MTVDNLFGVPLVLRADTRDELIRDLDRLWRDLIVNRPGDLQEDLALLAKRYFGFGVKVRSLRDVITKLSDFENYASMPEDVVLNLDDAAVITPEGRILLHVMLVLRDRNLTRVDAELHLWAVETARKARTTWQTQWLHKQFTVRLSPPALGAMLFLTVNRSIGRNDALRLPADDSDSRAVSAVVLPPINAFSEALGHREPSKDGIREHWAFTQVSRFMTRYVQRDTPKNDDAWMFIRPGQQDRFLEVLATDLASIDTPRRALAVDQFMSTYRDVRGRLAARGIAHEDPAWTRKVVRRITADGVQP